MNSRLPCIFLAALAASVMAAAPQDPGFESARISPTLYFPSAAEELASRGALHVRVNALQKEIAAAAPELLPTMLEAAEALLVALQRHAAFLRVQSLEDTTDQIAKAAGDAVGADWSALNAALRSRLVRVPAADISTLGQYGRLASMAQQDADHSVAPEAARYRSSVIMPVQANLADAYNRLVRTIGSAGASSRDTATRRAAITRRNEAYDQIAPVVAAQLATVIDLQNRDAVAQGYANAADRKYRSLQFSDGDITRTLAAVEAQAPVYRDYQQLLGEHAAHKLGLSPVLAAKVDLAATPWPRAQFSQARQLVLDAFAPLGADYTSRFARLLDPANGRLDLTGGSHRARTGTSIAVYDAPVAFFFTGYDGSLTSIGTLAHEGGHAIHRELMNAGGAPVYERSGPHYLFEGFAIFNELLVLNQASRVSKTPLERAAALERLLSKLSFELFVSAEETVFERALYRAAAGHALLDRGSIDALYRDSIAPYESWPVADVGASREWMRKALLFEDPLYLVNYLYAQLVAVALYDKSRTDSGFASKYAALLRRGFDADAREVLETLQIRLEDPALVTAAAQLIRAKTEELRELYRRQ